MPSPRRVPQQLRSRQMVDRIVDAAVLVLARDGYQRASTNRIAAEAGVSPGSLYQYFTGREAIVAEVTQRLVDDFTTSITPALRRAATLPREAASRSLIGAVLEALERHAELLRAIVDRIPPGDQATALRDVRLRLTDAILGLFVIQGVHGPQPVLDQAAWMIVETAQHLTVRYVLDAPVLDRVAFVDALVDVLAVLTPAGDPPSSPAGPSRRQS